jgi:hypothetical protein
MSVLELSGYVLLSWLAVSVASALLWGRFLSLSHARPNANLVPAPQLARRVVVLSRR